MQKLSKTLRQATRKKVPAIVRAIKAAGGLTPVADYFGISPQAVWLWVERGYPPANRCIGLEELTGITRHQLREDIFGRKA